MHSNMVISKEIENFVKLAIDAYAHHERDRQIAAYFSGSRYVYLSRGQGGSGVGVRGVRMARKIFTPLQGSCPPSPQPSPPEYGGRGSNMVAAMRRARVV